MWWMVYVMRLRSKLKQGWLTLLGFTDVLIVIRNRNFTVSKVRYSAQSIFYAVDGLSIQFWPDGEILSVSVGESGLWHRHRDDGFLWKGF